MANNHNTVFSLDRKDFVLVKPAKPTSSCVLSLSGIDNKPNLEHIGQTVYVYRSNVDVSNQADPARVIREALSKALVYYYPLAGKLKKNSDGKLQINCTADGVPFLVATSNCDLSSLHYLDGVDVEVTRQFVYDVPSEGDSGCHPLVLQVTKFSCGGFIIGMGMSHSVCDGFSAGQFLQALAELASGENEPSVKPVWERERLVVTPTEEPFQSPVDNTSIATSPYFPTTDFLHECFYVGGESIKRLKMSLMEECGSQNLNESFTTVEALASYVWRSRFRALKLNSDGKILFLLTVGIKKRLNPPLPDGYYGNAFTEENIVLTGGELNEAPLSKIVKLIKDTKKVASNSDYIMHSLVVLERFREVNIKFKAGGALMDFTDWRQLGLLDIDFGWKVPINIVPVPMNMIGYEDLCMFSPPSNVYPSKKDGVRVFISLPRAAMAKFKEEIDALKIAGDGACVSAL
ncbi:spermidine coumaroyl-CoA acyltransferase-like [Quercus robur]|uniref:spermidine coumaroyl-CoA acyltransferase-like n=1 Tax=Quercus robur TaxID=38942 RepID=UPI002163CBCF|nr:spermidine coumaroyl-CoA acyltransferase-like [Quercus robur]